MKQAESRIHRKGQDVKVEIIGLSRFQMDALNAVSTETKIPVWIGVQGNACKPLNEYPTSTQKGMLENLEEAWSRHSQGKTPRYKAYINSDTLARIKWLKRAIKEAEEKPNQW